MNGILPEVDVEASCPETVWVNLQPPAPDEVVTPLPIHVTVTNRGFKAIHLTVTSLEEVLNWNLYDAEGALVQSEPSKIGLPALQELKIQPGEKDQRDLVATLDGRLLGDEQTYVLRANYFGEIPLEVTFQARHAV